MEPRLKWAEPYSASTLDAAENLHGFQFPPDVRQLYLARKPSGYGIWDWETVTAEMFAERQEWIAHGFAFDVVYNNFWYDPWGVKPSVLGTPPKTNKLEAVKEFCAPITKMIQSFMDKQPRLIPMGARYMPTAPSIRGLPVLSINQTDIIYYGMNLRNYFMRDFGEDIGSKYGEIIDPSEIPDVPNMPFWTDFLSKTRNFS